MASEWHQDFLLQNQPGLDDIGSGPSDRALQNTSGNIQSYSDSIAHHSDAVGRDDHLHHQLAYKYPHPVTTAPPHGLPLSASFHPQQALNARIQQKKLRRINSVGHGHGHNHGHGHGHHHSNSSRRARSYLKSQKYMEYRARPRRDTGKDGEPVWSDELEDAFQQGKQGCVPLFFNSFIICQMLIDV